jgi:ubiquinone/menaquinone biosynthesis C-methylase UbiE
MIPHNKSIDVSSKEEIVDCIQSQIYGEFPLKLVSLLEQLPYDNYSDFLRVTCVPYLFHEADKIFKGETNPIHDFKKVLQGLINQISQLTENKSLQHIFDVSTEKHEAKLNQTDVALATGVHYGNLFKDFNLSQYLEAKELLETRLVRNHVNLPKINEATLLDQGCGGGRYTIAWKLLGVKKAIGLDISEIGIEDARRKLEHLKLEGVEFTTGSVLDLPYASDSFDIVYSNGVLHHTLNWEQGIHEQVRVLKPGGFGWQYLIENPGGIFWDKIEILRAILKNVSKEYAQKVMAMLGVPNNRIFYMLDHVMVPINTRITPDELYTSLSNAGAKDIRRLERGTDFDRVEMIYQKIPYAREKFGVGENRFVFSK